jgi:hypothetical protein
MFFHSVPGEIRFPATLTLSGGEGHNGQNKTRFPGTLAKTIVEEKESDKIVGKKNKQDNAPQPSRFSATILGIVVVHNTISFMKTCSIKLWIQTSLFECQKFTLSRASLPRL